MSRECHCKRGRLYWGNTDKSAMKLACYTIWVIQNILSGVLLSDRLWIWTLLTTEHYVLQLNIRVEILALLPRGREFLVQIPWLLCKTHLITSLTDWARLFPGSPFQPLAKMESSFSEKGQNEIVVIPISNSDSESVSLKWSGKGFESTFSRLSGSTGWECWQGAFGEEQRLSNWTV